MAFTFANVNKKSALIRENSFFDLETISDGAVSADPMEALTTPEVLHDLSENLDNFAASGNVDDVVLGAPVPRPTNSFGIGLNYQTHVDEAAMETPDVPMVFADEKQRMRLRGGTRRRYRPRRQRHRRKPSVGACRRINSRPGFL